MGITIPEKDGGIGGTLMDAVIAIEQVALVCPRSADVVQFGNFGPIRTFAEYATPAQKQRWLPALLSGGAVISLGMSEPDAGSAVTELDHQRQAGRQSLRHQRHRRCFRPSAPTRESSWSTCAMGRGLDGIGSVLVERGTPGFTVGTPSSFMSGEEWSRAAFRELPHPGRERAARPRRLQEADRELQRRAASATPRARSRSAATPTTPRATTARRASSSAGRCANSRACNGSSRRWRSSSKSRSSCSIAPPSNADRGLPSAYETAVAKAACNQAGFEVAHEAVQAMGAMGYSREALVEYCMRRCRGWMIAGGSIEMLKNRIAEHVFDRRFDQRPPRKAEAAEIAST